MRLELLSWNTQIHDDDICQDGIAQLSFIRKTLFRRERSRQSNAVLVISKVKRRESQPRSHFSISGSSFHTLAVSIWTRDLLSSLITDLLQLSHIPLLPRLTHKPHPIQSNLLPITISINNEHYQARHILELDISQVDLGCACLRIPVLRLNGHRLCRSDAFRLVKPKDVSSIREELDLARAHGDLVFVVVIAGGRRQRREM